MTGKLTFDALCERRDSLGEALILMKDIESDLGAELYASKRAVDAVLDPLYERLWALDDQRESIIRVIHSLDESRDSLAIDVLWDYYARLQAEQLDICPNWD